MNQPIPESAIGACSWSLRPTDPCDLLASLYRAGIDACQLALVPLVESPREWSSAVEALARGGVRVISGMLAMLGEDYSTLDAIRSTGGVASDSHWTRNFERVRAVAAAAARHGIPLVTFHAGFLPHNRTDPRRRVLLGRLRAVADVFAAHDVNVAFETGQETAETLLDALDDLGSSNVGVNFDPANMILYGMGDPVEAIEKLGRHVVQVHVKDAVPTAVPGTWGREAAVGRGTVDWPRFFEAVAKLPRRVDLVIEREAGENRVAEIASAKQFIASHLESKGR